MFAQSSIYQNKVLSRNLLQLILAEVPWFDKMKIVHFTILKMNGLENLIFLETWYIFWSSSSWHPLLSIPKIVWKPFHMWRRGSSLTGGYTMMMVKNRVTIICDMWKSPFDIVRYVTLLWMTLPTMTRKRRGDQREFIKLQLNKCETDPYFLQNFQCTTMFISVFCKSCEPMLCEPEIVQKFCSWCQWG